MPATWPAEVYLGPPEQHYIPADEKIQIWRNTTRVANPACLAECSPPNPCTPATVPPYPRPSRDWCIDNNPDPGPTRDCCVAQSGIAWPVPANSYVASSPPAYANFARCRKWGFKNLFIIRARNGIAGPKSLATWRPVARMTGEGNCQTRDPVLASDPIKYLTVTADASYNLGSAAASMHRSSSIDPYSGRNTVEATNVGTGDALDGARAALGMAWTHIAGVVPLYLGTVASFATYGTCTFSGFGTVATCDFDASYDLLDGDSNVVGRVDSYGHAEADLSAGTFARQRYWHYLLRDSPGGTVVLESEATFDAGLTLTDAGMHYWSTVTPGAHVGGDASQPEAWYCDTFYKVVYADAEVNGDVAAMASVWPMADDRVYPWRLDEAWSLGPLVTRNDRGPTFPQFMEPGMLDTSLPARPEMPEGCIIGVPNPAGYEPYWDFRHETWEKTGDSPGMVGEIWRIKTYGAAAPAYCPHATQWINNLHARHLPYGPFVSYNVIKNSATFTTNGCPIVFMGGYMVSQIWCETHMFAKPGQNPARPCGPMDIAADKFSGNCTTPSVTRWANVPCDCDDPAVTSGCGSASPPTTDYDWNDPTKKGEYVYKVCEFDFRAFFESVYDRDGAWNRSQESTGCPNWTPIAPFNYIEHPENRPGGNPIGTGSYYFSGMSATEGCIVHAVCHPNVIYVSPVQYPFPPNAKWHQMPPLSLDDQYGAYWCAEVVQWRKDPLWKAPGPDPTYIDKMCAEDCALEEDDGSCLEDDELNGICYYPLRPFVEARNSLPAGAPAMPADAEPEWCVDVIAALNADPPQTVPGACTPSLAMSLVLDSGCGGLVIYTYPIPRSTTWGIQQRQEDCVRRGGRFSTEYQRNGVYAPPIPAAPAGLPGTGAGGLTGDEQPTTDQ